MIRSADVADLPRLHALYAAARQFMREHGNPTQWGEHYPPEARLREDIDKAQLYVFTPQGDIAGAFVMQREAEGNYENIEGGTWRSETPYLTLHRIATSGKTPGLFAAVMDFARAESGHIRIDTHPDNKVMQARILREGFLYRGVVTVEDGSIRFGYDYLAERSSAG